MNLFKKSAKAFTTWRSSLKSSSESKQKKHDDYTDALAYLAKCEREVEYQEALERLNSSMATQSMSAAHNAIWPAQQGFNTALTGAGMAAVNQVWAPHAPLEPMRDIHPTRQFSVEKVDNGFILRSGRYSKICKDMEELSNQFIAVMVEAQLDK